MFLNIKKAPLYRSIFFYSLSLSPFLFFILNGNFLVDDWGQLSNGISLLDQINSWKSLWAYRPISWVAIPTFLNLFNDNFILLAIFHLSLYLFSVFQLISWKKLEFNLFQKRIAGLLLLSPVFASSFILSPVNQLSASLSFLFFGLGLFYERKTSQTGTTLPITYVFFLLSLLCYEISLPLIFTHYLFVITSDPKRHYRLLAFPSIVLMLVFWQKIVAVYLFSSDFSRLEGLSPIPLLSFVVTYFISIPLALFEGLFKFYFFALLLSIFLYFIYHRAGVDLGKVKFEKNILLTLLIGLFSSSSLFLFSGRYSLIEGYQNRGLTSSWILFSLMLVALLRSRKILLSLVIILVTSINYILFVDKIVEAVRASDVGESVVGQILNQETLVNRVPQTIIVDIPCLLTNSSFRSEVFCTSWDLRGALLSKGLQIPNVWVTEDALSTFLIDLDSKESIQIVTFNEEFELVRVEPLTTELQDDLVSKIDLRAKESKSKIEDCKYKISQLVRLQTSGSLSEYLKCARHPLA